MARDFHAEHTGGMHHGAFMGPQDDCQACHVDRIRDAVDRDYEESLREEQQPVRLSNPEQLKHHLKTAHWHEDHEVDGADWDELMASHDNHHVEYRDEFDARGGSATMGDEHFHNREN